MFVDSVGEEFRQGTVQMTRLYSVLSEPQLERPASWDDSATGCLEALGEARPGQSSLSAGALRIAVGAGWLCALQDLPPGIWG